MTDDVAQTYWRSLAAHHDARAFATLLAAYGEPHRAYHSWAHILDLLDKLDELKHLAARADLIAAAIFWHDAVYATRGADGLLRADIENVRASAALFEQHARFDKIEADAVHEMIMATAQHLEARATQEYYPGFAEDLDLFLDLDLASLAAPWPEFEANLHKIRFEYVWVPEPIFLLGRLHLLEGFASYGERLYRRAQTRARWAAPAIDNLERATTELRAHIARLANSA